MIDIIYVFSSSSRLWVCDTMDQFKWKVLICISAWYHHICDWNISNGMMRCCLFRIVNHFRSFWSDIVGAHFSVCVMRVHPFSMFWIRIQICSDLNSCVLTIEIHAQLHIPCIILFRKKIAIKEKMRLWQWE